MNKSIYIHTSPKDSIFRPPNGPFSPHFSVYSVWKFSRSCAAVGLLGAIAGQDENREVAAVFFKKKIWVFQSFAWFLKGLGLVNTFFYFFFGVGSWLECG